jgi:hypothetical protein
MSGQLAVSVKVLFGLAFDIEKDSNRKSGFRPADIDLGAKMKLYGDVRLAGFAAALQTGFAQKLILAGGDEGRYKNETPIINRAESIRKMLIDDYDIDPTLVDAYPSRSNTGGNIAIFSGILVDQQLMQSDCGLMTNLYHEVRASWDLMAGGLWLRLVPAESMILLANPDAKGELIRALDGGELARRIVEEANGIMEKVRGTYAPRTDTPPMLRS